MNLLKHKKIFFGISIVLILSALFSVSVWGLNVGIDFIGGTLIEVTYKNLRPEVSTLSDDMDSLGFRNSLVQYTDTNGVLIRTREIQEGETQILSSYFTESGSNIERFSSIGPSLGKELRNKAYTAISLVLIIIIIFIWFAFRHVGSAVQPWKYGIVSIVALFHDIVIPTGLIAILGRFAGVSVDALFVTALLAILGLSVNDTIVVFDRIRENLKNKVAKEFSDVVNISLSQTITRSVNTTITTLFVLIALFFLGPESTQTFALILGTGLIAGTYSSIFLASPLLVILSKK
jgi:preprotein translocase subunit SecF